MQVLVGSDISKVLEIFLEHGVNPWFEDHEGILPVSYFKDPEQFDPTIVFQMIQSMVMSGSSRVASLMIGRCYWNCA